MICYKSWSAPLAVAVIIATAYGVQARSVADSEKRISDDDGPAHFSSSSSSSSSFGPLEHSITKRSVQDSSCRGINDLELWRELDRVCQDCHNLYRKPIVSIECRRGCFSSDYFTMCVADLLLPVKRYDTYARALREDI